MIAARSRKAGARPNREERLESWARPGAKARSVRSYRVHWLTRRRRFNAATLRASIGFPFASRRPLPTIDPSPLSGAITDGGGPARIRSSPSNVVQSGPWSTRLSSTTKPQLSHTRSPRTGSTYRAKLPQFRQRALPHAGRHAHLVEAFRSGEEAVEDRELELGPDHLEGDHRPAAGALAGAFLLRHDFASLHHIMCVRDISSFVSVPRFG